MKKKIILLHIILLVLFGYASQNGSALAVRPSYERQHPDEVLVSPRGTQKAGAVAKTSRKSLKAEETVEDTCLPEELEEIIRKSNNDPYKDLDALAEKYIGTRYRAGGTDESKGFDCSGFVWRVFSDLGFEDFPRAASSSVYMGGQEVDRKDLQKGDLCFFNTSGRGVSHVGIMLDSVTFVHSSTSDGVIYTNLESDSYWRNRIVGFRRYTFQ